MFRVLYILMIAVLLVVPDAAAQKTSAKSIKKEQNATKQKIKETNKKIQNNTAETTRSLNRLNRIEAEMSEQKKSIDSISQELSTINRKLALIEDSIATTEKELARLKDNYTRAVRSVRARSSSLDRMLFIFSAESFNQAYRRMRYLRQFSEWRNTQTEKITVAQAQLKAQHSTLAIYQKQRATALAKQNNERIALLKKKQEQAKEITALKKEGKALQKVLAEQERRAAQLDDALNKLIAEEERKAALRAKQEEEKRLAEEKRQKELKAQAEAKKQKEEEAAKKEKNKSNKKKKDKQQDNAKAQVEKKPIETPKAEQPKVPEQKKQENPEKSSSGYSMNDTERTLSGSFENNKGNLLFPVTGKYTIVRPFGRQRHPELKYVQTDNGGIDIETTVGNKARAVFDGKVSAVFRQDGFNTIVMVRHGNYLTIYVNLSEIYVTNGDMVKAGQAIGKIFSDPDDDNRTILHFEVRKEREKLNPQEWVK